MMPPTKNGLDAMEVLSAMQKCIRRGMEREAMEFAVELIHTSKGYCTMVCNRLEVASHEDIDTSRPGIVPFVAAACAQAKNHYKPERLDSSRMMIGNAIRIMSRAWKSREGVHFQAAVGLRAVQEDFVPVVPDWAKDMHTTSGREMGRGVDHYLSEGSKLTPEPGPDRYEDEALGRWAVKFGGSR